VLRQRPSARKRGFTAYRERKGKGKRPLRFMCPETERLGPNREEKKKKVGSMKEEKLNRRANMAHGRAAGQWGASSLKNEGEGEGGLKSFADGQKGRTSEKKKKETRTRSRGSRATPEKLLEGWPQERKASRHGTAATRKKKGKRGTRGVRSKGETRPEDNDLPRPPINRVTV